MENRGVTVTVAASRGLNRDASMYRYRSNRPPPVMFNADVRSCVTCTYALDCHAVKPSSMRNGSTPGCKEYGLSNPSGAALLSLTRNCLTLPPNWNLLFDAAVIVASYLRVVSDSRESA